VHNAVRTKLRWRLASMNPATVQTASGSYVITIAEAWLSVLEQEVKKKTLIVTTLMEETHAYTAGVMVNMDSASTANGPVTIGSTSNPPPQPHNQTTATRALFPCPNGSPGRPRSPQVAPGRPQRLSPLTRQLTKTDSFVPGTRGGGRGVRGWRPDCWTGYGSSGSPETGMPCRVPAGGPEDQDPSLRC